MAVQLQMFGADMSEHFLDGKIALHCGDCLDVLKTLDGTSIDSCVSDPPYHLTNNTGTRKYTPIGRPKEPKGGFMGKQWDGGDIAFRPDVWREVFRILKPGAYLLACGGTRTYHRMACAVEDAGFEIRDCVLWITGQGFPKNRDISKAIDSEAGAEREVVGQYQHPRDGYEWHDGTLDGTFTSAHTNPSRLITAPATDAAREWQGFGTALKPACELLVLARKPLSESTVAGNVLRWGTGAINVDGCRIDFVGPDGGWGAEQSASLGYHGGTEGSAFKTNKHSLGRWPANVIHDGSEEVVAGFPDAGGGFGVRGTSPNWGPASGNGGTLETVGYGDTGSAARFFYSAKADSDDRLGSKHPTVKPLDLMQYLVRLVTPPDGLVLDPFAGTGTTGEAAWREGMRAVLIEREAEYQADICRRMRLCMSGPDERAREAMKAKLKDKPLDYGPLFGTLT